MKSHQRGSLRVLLIDLFSLSQQFLNVPKHPPLRRRSGLIDHLLGDACQSEGQERNVALKTREVCLSEAEIQCAT